MLSLTSLLVEPAIYAAIGFLAAALLSLPLFGVAHRRAERLTRQHLDTLLPMSVKELEADKDLLRAEHALSTQRLKTILDDLRAKTAAQQVAISRHNGTVARLKAELGDKTQTIAALEAREAARQQRLRALEQEHALQSVHLEDARRALRDKEAELVRVAADLATRTAIAEQQNVELARARAEAEALRADAENDARERTALNARLARYREEIDAAGRQLADERRKLEELARDQAAKSALLVEARAALDDKEAELARLATDLATRAAGAVQQDVALARTHAEVEALKINVEHDKRERGRMEGLGRRTTDRELELIAQRDAADAMAQLGASRICEQARRLAEREYETERLQAALDAARRAEAGLRYELTQVEERRMLESKAALAEKAALEIQVARLQLDREQLRVEAANGAHAGGAPNGHGVPVEPHVVRLDPIVMRERRAREETAPPHPGAN